MKTIWYADGKWSLFLTQTLCYALPKEESIKRELEVEWTCNLLPMLWCYWISVSTFTLTQIFRVKCASVHVWSMSVSCHNDSWVVMKGTKLAYKTQNICYLSFYNNKKCCQSLIQIKGSFLLEVKLKAIHLEWWAGIYSWNPMMSKAQLNKTAAHQTRSFCS